MKEISHSKLNGQLATSVKMAINWFDKPRNDKAPFKLLSGKLQFVDQFGVASIGNGIENNDKLKFVGQLRICRTTPA